MSVVSRTILFMIIDYDTCIKREISCADCVVSFFIAPKSEKEISPELQGALELLASREILKPLQFIKQTG